MERSSTSVRPQNPTFAILGLSHIESRCADASKWSSSLSVSCFGRSNSASGDDADYDETMDATSTRPLRRSLDDGVIRQHSTRTTRRRLDTSLDRQPTKPPHPPPAIGSTSLQAVIYK